MNSRDGVGVGKILENGLVEQVEPDVQRVPALGVLIGQLLTKGSPTQHNTHQIVINMRVTTVGASLTPTTFETVLRWEGILGTFHGTRWDA